MQSRATGAGNRLASLIAGITSILLFTAAPSTARDTAHRPTFEFGPGVVVDPAQCIAYLTAPRGGIEALALSSGQPVWVTAEPAKPLLVNDGLLLVQGEDGEASNVLRLRSLDAANGGRLLRSTDVPLPQQVRATLQDGLGTAFRLTARDIDHRVLVTWEFHRQFISGRSPLPEELARERHERGALRLDLKTGRAEILRAPQPGTSAGEEMPDPLRRLAESKSLPGSLWRADAAFATAFRGRGAEQSRITLRRWDARTGSALAGVVLSEEGHTIRHPPADGLHLLISRLPKVPGRSSLTGHGFQGSHTGRKPTIS